MMPDNEELVERLRRKRQVQPEQGSGSITVDPVTGETTVKCTITDDGYRLVNPDGPEAATRIEQLHERLAETQMLAFKWMEAHDKLHAGRPYEFPKPADLPETVEQLHKEVERLTLLISERSIERLAEDIAIACVDCRPEIREARHSAMVRLGKRLREPLDRDIAALTGEHNG